MMGCRKDLLPKSDGSTPQTPVIPENQIKDRVLLENIKTRKLVAIEIQWIVTGALWQAPCNGRGGIC